MRRAAVTLLGYFSATAGDVRKRIAVALLGRLSDPARDVRLEALSSLARLRNRRRLRRRCACSPIPPRMCVGRRCCTSVRSVICRRCRCWPTSWNGHQKRCARVRRRPWRLWSCGRRQRRAGAGSGPTAAVDRWMRRCGALARALRDEVRPAVRAALLSLGSLAVPTLLTELAADRPGFQQLPPIIDILRDLAPPWPRREGAGRGGAGDGVGTSDCRASGSSTPRRRSPTSPLAELHRAWQR